MLESVSVENMTEYMCYDMLEYICYILEHVTVEKA